MKTEKKFKPVNIFGPLPCNGPIVVNIPLQQEVGRKEPTMYDYDSEYNDVGEAKDRLHNRVTNIASNTNDSLRKKFGLDGDDTPQTGRELVKRILDGQYVLPQEDTGWVGNLFNIKWRDPKKTPDRDGYDIVSKTLSDLTTAVRDEVCVLTPAEGLASLRKYEKDAAALVQ